MPVADHNRLVSTPLRIATFLAPNMHAVYEFITDRIGRALGRQTELIVGTSFAQFASGELDAGFICGLPYVQLMRQSPPPVELLAAPVLTTERYAGRPIYFSDVIVRQGDVARSFADVRGRSWAYNDLDSHSGYNLTRYTLVRMGEMAGYFSDVVAAGTHQRAIRMVATGEIDASAIDSQVLAIELRDHPELAAACQVIDTLGPSTIQPFVAATHLHASLRSNLREIVVSLHRSPDARPALAHGFVARFAPVTDEDYHDIRHMLEACEAADFLSLR